MKKLMMTVAVVAVAAISQAASFNWETTSKAFSVEADTLKALVDGQHYASASTGNANTMSNQLSSPGVAWSYVLTLSDGVTTDTLSGTLESGDFSSRMIGKGMESDLAYQDTSASRALSYSIVMTGKFTDENGTEWTLTSDAVAGTWSIPSKGDWAVLKTSGAAGWTAAGSGDVPEPTSGLLLLLGMAGLALRRKQA